MKLLVLIACLLIEKYLHIGGVLKRFSWFESYLSAIQHKLGKNGSLSKGYLGVIMILLPVWLPLLILGVALVKYQIGLSGIGLYFVVLLYCFGPNDLYDQLSLYFKSVDAGDKEHQVYLYKEITGCEFDDSSEFEAKTSIRKLTETILLRANCDILGIIFWFCIGSVPAVFLYRGLCLMSSMAAEGNEICAPFRDEVIRLYGVMNWVPARVTALLYSIVGGSQAYPTWKKLFWTDTAGNQTIVKECGVDSLVIGMEEPLVEESKKAMVLVDRAIILFVVIIFVFSLGAWFR